jgi:ketosteroid isomerase-like protein
MRAMAEVKWAVYKAADVLFDHIANGRLTPSVDCFTDDADVAMIGSEDGEVAIGPAAIRALFEALYKQPFRVIFSFPERRVSAHGNIAWFTAEGTFRLSTEDEERPYRLTGVLERRRDVWLWQLFSGSEPR